VNDDQVQVAPIRGLVERLVIERVDGTDIFTIRMIISTLVPGKLMEITWGCGTPMIDIGQEREESLIIGHIDLRFRSRELNELDGAQSQYRLIDTDRPIWPAQVQLVSDTGTDGKPCLPIPCPPFRE